MAIPRTAARGDVAVLRHPRGWARAAAVATAAYSLLLLLLVVAIYSEDHSVLAPLVALGTIGLAIAAAVAATASRPAAWLAVGFSLVALAADAPYQAAELLHPTSPAHTVSSAILILAGVASLLVAVKAASRR